MIKDKKSSENTLYGLVFGIPTQQALITEHCFGTCGKIIFGAVDGGDEIGSLLICRTPANDCPHLDRELDEPIGDVNGESIFLRKLKA